MTSTKTLLGTISLVCVPTVEQDKAVAFYESLGFATAGRTRSMWIYAGSEH